MAEAEAAILIDAAISGAAPGTIRRLDALAQPLPREIFGVSTHGFGLAEAIELARVLKRLPAYCVIYAIEARDFETGAPLSPEVAGAVDVTVARIFDELRELVPA